MLAVEADTSLTQHEKATKRQQLITGKAAMVEEEEEDDKEVNVNDMSVSDILTQTLKCSICIQLPERPVTTPCGHTFCLKCFQKWIRQGKKTCVECRKNIPAKMASQSRINSAQAYAINRMAMRASSNNNNDGGVGPSQESHEDLPTANVCSEKIFVIVSSYHFGPITAEHDPERNQDVLVGETWPSTQECKQRGVHFEHIGGIHGESSHGAQSVALSGGYVDDEDHGEWFLYTGSGEKDLSGNKRNTKKHSSDQDSGV